MAAGRKPKCFVAMAFDREDTDQLYEKSILPVLKSNGITPIVINRREDNRDINQQIIEQLESCDFCIADLTYTRPSVYFEAGYAQRAVQVIYTVRADHLHKNQPEDRRVHFDLQMKPLIRWHNVDDADFRTKLEGRLRATVLREWSKKQATQNKVQAVRAQFSYMSLHDRLDSLRIAAFRTLRKLGYRELYSAESHIKLRPKDATGYTSLLSGSVRNHVLYVVVVGVADSLPRNVLREEFASLFRYSHHLRGIKPSEPGETVRQIVEHHVFCSIADIPKSTITKALPSLSWDPSMLCYVIHASAAKHQLPYFPDVKNGIFRDLFIHFIKRIQSLPEFEAELTETVQRIAAKQQP